jgi:hypothetical protein
MLREVPRGELRCGLRGEVICCDALLGMTVQSSPVRQATPLRPLTVGKEIW